MGHSVDLRRANPRGFGVVRGKLDEQEGFQGGSEPVE